MNHLMGLKNALCEDYQAEETYRTQKTLMEIGITSTFLKIGSNQIKLLQKESNVRPIEFLREIYKIISGIDFVAEGHSKLFNY